MPDPREADYDRAEAERLRYAERRENNPNLRRELEQAAQEYDSEADEIESDIASEESSEE